MNILNNLIKLTRKKKKVKDKKLLEDAAKLLELIRNSSMNRDPVVCLNCKHKRKHSHSRRRRIIARKRLDHMPSVNIQPKTSTPKKQTK